jgi:DNA-binding NtrC family response regulator
MAHTVMVVDDERHLLSALARALDLEGIATVTAASGEEALALFPEHEVDLILLDVKLPRMDGIATLQGIRNLNADVPVVMMSGHATVDTAVQATKLGADNFVEKPIGMERLMLLVRSLLRLRDTLKENRALREAAGRPGTVIGESPAMRELVKKVEQVAPANARVLILGENGTGKEVVAQAIHARSKRASRPFVKLNVAAVPAELIESELFGHERGAFTGAQARRTGRFEQANGGTLLLDEIGDMPLAMQAKVLRVLQENELERVGGTETIRVDVRVLASTNKDLEKEIERQRFREDLYYRLNVVTLNVPPLRERPGDIGLLARYFLEDAARRNDMRARVLSPEALTALGGYRYPGNVRELRNLIERLCILSRGDAITEADVADALPLDRAVTAAVAAGPPGGGAWRAGATYADMVAEAERKIIQGALGAHGGHMTATAAALGLERSHLYKKMRSLGLR